MSFLEISSAIVILFSMIIIVLVAWSTIIDKERYKHIELLIKRAQEVTGNKPNTSAEIIALTVLIEPLEKRILQLEGEIKKFKRIIDANRHSYDESRKIIHIALEYINSLRLELRTNRIIPSEIPQELIRWESDEKAGLNTPEY